MSEAHLGHAASFSCYVFTSDNRLLLTMRGHAKTTWPGIWANSCNGHPNPGEPLSDAVSRVLRDELGLFARAELVLPASRHGMRGDGELCPVFRVVTDEVPTPDPVEVGDFEWVPWQEFVYAVTTGDLRLSPWCQPQVTELTTLGDDPARWPAVHAEFPTAA